MSETRTVVAAVLPDRFSNAPVLPFERGGQWFARGRSVAWASPFFLLTATVLVLLARWQLDLLGTGELIVLSYFSDALVFTWVFMGVAQHQADPALSPLRAGRQALRGRWRALAVCGLWGLPAALVSHLMFAYAPDLIKALVLTVGSNLAGLAALLGVVMAAAYATFLLSMLPVLAAIQAGRDPHATFKVAGLWALRALRCGRRPLAAVFVTFLSACVVAGAGLSYLYGHLPVQWLLDHPDADALLSYWYPWPGLLAALFVFVSMLQPMASDLLAAADVDLSDEILQHAHKAEYGERHVGWLLRRAGFSLRALAAFSLLLGLLYATLLGDQDVGSWLGSAFWLFLGGKLCTRWGNRRRQQAQAGGAEAAPTVADPRPVWVRWADRVLAVLQWGGLILGVSAVWWIQYQDEVGVTLALLFFALALPCWMLRRWWLGRYRRA